FIFRSPATAAASLQLELLTLQFREPAEVNLRQLTQRERNAAHIGFCRVVADNDFQYRYYVAWIEAVEILFPAPAVFHLEDIHKVENVAFARRRAVDVPREIDDDLTPFGRRHLDRVSIDREWQEATLAGDLSEAHALLGVGQLILARPRRSSDWSRSRAHQHESV